MPEKNLDIAIVIPSYDEGTDIDQTLVRISATAKRLNNTKVAIFVVINNAQTSPKEVKTSNKKTYDFITEIKERKNFKKRNHRHQKMMTYMQQSEVDFHAIDLFSEENAPKECNVGIARHQGFKVAGEYLKEDGVYIGTDADTLLEKNYLLSASSLSGGEIACSGPIDVEKISKNEKAMDALLHMEGVHQEIGMIAGINNFFVYKKHDKNRIRRHLAGSNMIIPKGVYDATNGIEPLAGAEDVTLGYKIIQAGYNVEICDCFSVKTSGRPSERTLDGAGLGFQQKKLLQAISPKTEEEEFCFEQVEYFEILGHLNTIAESTRSCKKSFIKYLNEALKALEIPVSSEQIERWADIWFKCDKVKYLIFSEHGILRVELAEAIHKKYPPNIKQRERADYTKNTLLPKITDGHPTLKENLESMIFPSGNILGGSLLLFTMVKIYNLIKSLGEEILEDSPNSKVFKRFFHNWVNKNEKIMILITSLKTMEKQEQRETINYIKRMISQGDRQKIKLGSWLLNQPDESNKLSVLNETLQKFTQKLELLINYLREELIITSLSKHLKRYFDSE